MPLNKKKKEKKKKIEIPKPKGETKEATEQERIAEINTTVERLQNEGYFRYLLLSQIESLNVNLEKNNEMMGKFGKLLEKYLSSDEDEDEDEEDEDEEDEDEETEDEEEKKGED